MSKDARILEEVLVRLKFLALATMPLLCLQPAAAMAEQLRWASATDIATLDPYAHGESFTSGVLAHVFDPLVRRGRTLEIEPALATEWELLDPVTWRFKLREGVKFHNGNPFTADDVIASITRIGDPGSRQRSNVVQIESVTKVDDLTIDIVTKGPSPLLLNDLAGVMIMDKEWMEANDALLPGNLGEGITTAASNEAVGTGPFKVVSYRPDAETNFVVNEDWWDTPQHNITAIQFKPVKSDATRVAALLSGEVDLITPAPLQDLARLESAPGIIVDEEPSLRVLMLALNRRPESQAFPGTPNPLNELKVRQALWHAIDMDSIQKRIMRGKSRNTSTFVAPPVPGYSEANDVPYGYDPELAKKLLAEAGFGDGLKLRLNCTNDRYINDEQICVAISSMWTRIGIETDLQVESRATFFPRQDRGELDVSLTGWATLPSMDGFSMLRSMLADTKDGFGGGNDIAYVHPRIEELTRLAAVELDETKRRGYISEGLAIAGADVAYIPLHQQPVAAAMSDRFDIPQFADEYIRLWYATAK